MKLYRVEVERTETWKEELRKRYEAMPNADWFRQAHEGKSLGDSLTISGDPEGRTVAEWLAAQEKA